MALAGSFWGKNSADASNNYPGALPFSWEGCVIHAKSCLYVLASIVLAGAFSGCCCCMGEMAPPADGVQVRVTTSLTDEQNDVVKEKLEAMVDSPRTSSMILNGQATYNISPVDHVMTFAEAIEFGTVTSVDEEGRIITLDVKPEDLE